MCLCIFRPSNIVLTKALLKKAYSNNPDSWGFAYPHDNEKEMVIVHGLGGFRQFWQAYRQIPKEKPALIHYRIATSGGFDEQNCHPFLIDKKHALIHNGNIENKLNEKLDKLSDTAIFVEKILRPLFKHSQLKNKSFWTSGAFQWLIEESLGGTNKIVILDSKGRETIYNEDMGEWEDNGAWFSNNTYKINRKSIRGAKTEIVETNGQRKEITTYQSNRTITKYLPPLPKKETDSKSQLEIAKDPPFAKELIKRSPQLDMIELY